MKFSGAVRPIEELAIRQRALEVVLGNPGYIEDVARRLIALATFPNDRDVSCRYGGVLLHATPTSTVEGICRDFHRMKARALLAARPNLFGGPHPKAQVVMMYG